MLRMYQQLRKLKNQPNEPTPPENLTPNILTLSETTPEKTLDESRPPNVDNYLDNTLKRRPLRRTKSMDLRIKREEKDTIPQPTIKTDDIVH